jgi:hypothetical protein
MKESFVKLLTWLSATVTVASIIHALPIIFGIIGSFLWMGVAYYKRHQSRTEDERETIEKKRSAVELQIAELQLKRLQDGK